MVFQCSLWSPWLPYAFQRINKMTAVIFFLIVQFLVFSSHLTRCLSIPTESHLHRWMLTFLSHSLPFFLSCHTSFLPRITGCGLGRLQNRDSSKMLCCNWSKGVVPGTHSSSDPSCLRKLQMDRISVSYWIAMLCLIFWPISLSLDLSWCSSKSLLPAKVLRLRLLFPVERIFWMNLIFCVWSLPHVCE